MCCINISENYKIVFGLWLSIDVYILENIFYSIYMNIYYTRNCLSIKIIKDILLVSEMAWFPEGQITILYIYKIYLGSGCSRVV